MKRREFVQTITALAAGGALSNSVTPPSATAAPAPQDEVTKVDNHAGGLKKPPVGPKLTWKQLEEATDLTAADGRKYHAELPASWDNAEWVAEHPTSNPPPHWPQGHEQNQRLKRAIVQAFVEAKQIDLTDPHGSPWLLAWRMYPNAEHPLWKNAAGMDFCGCNCGCFAPRVWADK